LGLWYLKATPTKALSVVSKAINVVLIIPSSHILGRARDAIVGI